ncbi:MAG TPA: ABC transporter substrate-binding protein [Candidatus Limnocylindrales bacterium]|nr:ABC transporter substrate-binding protein [Candidatus Limnocylindrales bacterium]
MVRTKVGSALAVLALVFAACTPGASPTPGSPGTSPGTSPTGGAPSPTSAVKEGGTLVVALPGDMTAADPSFVSDSNSSYIHLNVVEGLLGTKPGSISEIEPVLAAEMPTVSDDLLTYTFKLREGIKFHDGEPFNAEAVVYNYERQLNAPEPLRDNYNYYFGAVFGGFAEKSNLASVTAIDATTVEFKLKQPQSNFLISQAPLPQFGIQSPKALKAGDADNPDPAKSPYAQGKGTGLVGTGPFKFKEWVPNDHVTIVKNEDYWNAAAKAHLDEVIFKPYADQTAEFNALQSGDIDMAQTILPNDAQSLEGNAEFQVFDRGDSCNVAVLQMNHTHKPLDNKDVRFAIAHALNKQAYIDAFYAGQAVPADNWMPPATQYYKALNLPTYDEAKAKEYITKSGLSGADLTIEFWYPADVSRPYMPDPKALAEAIATDLEKVGFTINFKTAGWRTGYLRDEAVGKFPMWLLGWTCDWAGPDNFLSTAFFHGDGGKPNKEFAYGPPELLSAFDKGLAAPTEADVKAAWEEAQDILARDLPTVPLVHSRPPAAGKAFIKGFVGAGNLNEALNTVWLDK